MVVLMRSNQSITTTHNKMNVKRRILLLITSVSSGMAFMASDSPVTRWRSPPQQRPSHSHSGGSPRLHTIPTSTVSTNQQQLSMIPRKVLLDMLLEYTAAPPLNQDGTRHLRSTTTTTWSQVVPLAFLTKAFTTPAAAWGFTGATTMVTTAAAAGSILSHPSDAVTVETQVLNDMSHLGIDLAAFFVPSLLLLRIAAIIGRICTITADYIPDHVIVPEELAFQMAMLCLACSGLIKSALIPAAASVYNATSVKDGRAYGSIFQPAGTSWSQYKALSVCGALEWMTLQAGDEITTSSSVSDNSSENDKGEDFMYWLYAGNVDVKTDSGELAYAVSSGKKASSALHRGLIGEQSLLQHFGKTSKPQPVRSSHKQQRDGPSKSVSNGHHIFVTSPSATLLRINTRRLQMLMDLDPTLAESMRTMVFQGMEAKLQAQVQETTNLLKSFNVTASTSTVAF